METIQKEAITPVHNYATNIGTPKHIKQILMDVRERLTETQT